MPLTPETATPRISHVSRQAGLRACKEFRSSLPRVTQWLLWNDTLAYRCGGSTGVSPVSRFITRPD